MPRKKRSKVAGKQNSSTRWCSSKNDASSLVSDSSIVAVILQTNERFSSVENSFNETLQSDCTTMEHELVKSPNYIIIDIEMLTKLFSKQLCNICRSSGLHVVLGRKFGFCHELKVTCDFCDTVASETLTSRNISKHQRGLNEP